MFLKYVISAIRGPNTLSVELYSSQLYARLAIHVVHMHIFVINIRVAKGNKFMRMQGY